MLRYVRTHGGHEVFTILHVKPKGLAKVGKQVQSLLSLVILFYF
jgi:hypothetical protein